MERSPGRIHARPVSPEPRMQSVAYSIVWSSFHDGLYALQSPKVSCVSVVAINSGVNFKATSCQCPDIHRRATRRVPSEAREGEFRSDTASTISCGGRPGATA
jgi:hypothetical protein